MPRPKQISSIQTLAWLNATAENDTWDESEGKMFLKAYITDRQIQTKFDLHWK